MQETRELPEINEALMYETLDYIREHPEEWDQCKYFCGTTACFAGRAVLISLGSMEAVDASRSDFRQAEGTSAIARQELGLTMYEADSLFHLYTHDFDVLERAVKRVLSGELRP